MKLNEINFLSLGRFFTMLSSAAQAPANKKLALTIGQNYAMHDRPIFADANKYNDFVAYKIKASFVDSLSYQFRNESNLCKKMLNDLKLSLPVFASTSYQQRLNIMKKELLGYLAPYISPDSINLPRLLFKFGANHVSRSNDLTNNFEVGNLADNLAEAANKKSLHILILGKNGTVNAMAPVNNAVAIQPYNILTDGDLAAFKSFTEPLKGDEWAVYDLRPIRRALILGKLHIANETLYDYVKGYDLLVVFARVNGSKFIE